MQDDEMLGLAPWYEAVEKGDLDAQIRMCRSQVFRHAREVVKLYNEKSKHLDTAMVFLGADLSVYGSLVKSKNPCCKRCGCAEGAHSNDGLYCPDMLRFGRTTFSDSQVFEPEDL